MSSRKKKTTASDDGEGRARKSGTAKAGRSVAKTASGAKAGGGAADPDAPRTRSRRAASKTGNAREQTPRPRRTRITRVPAPPEPDVTTPPPAIEPAPAPPQPPGPVSPWLGEHDLHFFNEGTHRRLFQKLGAHVAERDGRRGVHFAVWAPNARYVSVIGDFNAWNSGSDPLHPLGSSGVWEGFCESAARGSLYKFHIESSVDGHRREKADPFAIFAEQPPRTASVVWDLEYEWNDQQWMKTRWARNALDSPISIYEMHLGSWRHRENGWSYGYRDIADPLIEHVQRHGFTHVEMMPLMEHPFYASWGYQVSGYFAATSRFGTPQDLMYLIDRLHQAGIGVILDWVPSHFPEDDHGLGHFDGTYLFEHADPRKGFHPDWKSLVFNYDRNEVRAFLLSSAIFWLDRYHADAIRVDAVASMLYLDYSRGHGQWVPNEHGGRENLGAISFLRALNEAVYSEFPDAHTIAEESTAWPKVSRPTSAGGLGFGMKWDMGWMNDTLAYFSRDPIHRRYHQSALTFRMIYAFNENFVLPLSHDEVVHGKGALVAKMPGDPWQRLANLRLLLAYQWMMPGKKLLFMGGELAQPYEWNHDAPLDWQGFEASPERQGISRLVADLNALYTSIPSLHERDFDPAGFEWIDCADAAGSTLSLLRWDALHSTPVMAVFNFTPVPRHDYRIGAPKAGHWRERLNTDSALYGGGDLGNMGGASTDEMPMHGRPCSLRLVLPPLAAIVLRYEGDDEAAAAIEW
ncbi:MAG TPA: 1,4-alpha-glucan branching protein GlgB [Candidatus Limnocylindrales bacterium]|nr:1,4-alpha-glucan branching protein GlgB [Candidatus Limnocylindrales bacterium]